MIHTGVSEVTAWGDKLLKLPHGSTKDRTTKWWVQALLQGDQLLGTLHAASDHVNLSVSGVLLLPPPLAS